MATDGRFSGQPISLSETVCKPVIGGQRRRLSWGTDTSPQLYASDLTDAEWAALEPLLPPESPIGRPRLHSPRTILNAIFESAAHRRCLAVPAAGVAAVADRVFLSEALLRRWRRDGTWERLHRLLREALRLRLGRDRQPSAGSIDSQSVKTTSVGGLRGFDSGKKINGRKRHVLVDTQGLVLKVVVHLAGVHDRVGAKQIFQGLPLDFPRLERV